MAFVVVFTFKGNKSEYITHAKLQAISKCLEGDLNGTYTLRAHASRPGPKPE